MDEAATSEPSTADANRRCATIIRACADAIHTGLGVADDLTIGHRYFYYILYL
jgi:hypothetical protein